MSLSNAELRKRLKDGLADQVGTVTALIAGNLPITDATQQKFLKDALADQAGAVTAKVVAGILEVEVQKVVFSNIPNFGVFKLNYNSVASANINYNDSIGTIQTKVRAITGLTSVTVTGSISTTGLTVRFVGVSGNALPLSVSANTLTISAIAATASIATTTPIVLTSVAAGTARNTGTFTIQVAPAAANPTNTILVVFTGTANAITCTITPNDGTNNSATPVNLTTANLVTLINTGAVTTVTLTDASSLRALQTATGGGAANFADGGEGDGLVGTFSGGVAAIATTTTVTETIPGNAGALTTTELKLLKDALADQQGELTAAIAAGTDFSS